MATVTEIISVRITINDPPCIAIAVVADKAALPTDPEPQTVYRATDTGRYWETDSNPAVEANYTNPKLYLADTTISSLFDDHGHDKASYKCIRLIMAKLGKELQIVRTSSGTESTEYTSLRDTYQYYKDLLKEFAIEKDENTDSGTGQWLRTRSQRRHVAGGLL